MPDVPYCPVCGAEIRKTEVNLDKWIVRCRDCGEESPLADVEFAPPQQDAEPVSTTPPRITLRPGLEHLEIQISLFSLPKFLLFLFIACFWNGIVSVFLGLAIAAVCYQILGYVPDWLPVLGLREGKPVMNDEVMGPGMTIFLCLFLTPFVAIGSYMILQVLLLLFGWTRILIHPDQSSITTGIGFVGYKRAFDPTAVRSVQHSAYSSQNGNAQYRIEMVTRGKTIKFGNLLSESQQTWLVNLLTAILVRKRPPKNQLIPEMPWLRR